jgi:hypothetical protein
MYGANWQKTSIQSVAWILVPVGLAFQLLRIHYKYNII